MSKSFFLDGLDENAVVACNNCEWCGKVSDVLSNYDLDELLIDDFEQRVSGGERTPACQCPNCGGLAHVEEGDGELERLRAEVTSLRAALEAQQKISAQYFQGLSRVVRREGNSSRTNGLAADMRMIAERAMEAC